MKVNLGCGKSKLEGYVNVDCNPLLKPDIVLDIRREIFPFPQDGVDQILLTHTIEHIEKRYHDFLLREIHRVLKLGGEFVVSYPEFCEVARNYINNYKGMQEFWEATIYGRQAHAGDYHVSLMDTRFFRETLFTCGFTNIRISQEPDEPYNTMIVCNKKLLTTMEELKCV